MREPTFESRERIAAARRAAPSKSRPADCGGSSGALDSLSSPAPAWPWSAPARPRLRPAACQAPRSGAGRCGLCVISGLALGIDGAAHEGALEAGAPTVGILGGGHARFFPRATRSWPSDAGGGRSGAFALPAGAGRAAVAVPAAQCHRRGAFRCPRRRRRPRRAAARSIPQAGQRGASRCSRFPATFDRKHVRAA